MKQSLKFGLLLVLALLIHCATNGAMEDMCKVSSPTYRQEKCYVSQDRPIQDALERLYNLYTTQTCDMSHTDVAHVPTDKSMFLLIAYFCDHYKHQSPPYPVSSHSPTYYYDPISYYIYGFEKDCHLAYSTVRLFCSSFITVGFILHRANRLIAYFYIIFNLNSY